MTSLRYTTLMWILFLGLVLQFAIRPAKAEIAAQDPVGKVVAIRGRVVALDTSSGSRRLAMKTPIFLKETIKTGSGRVQLLFKDRTIITLGPKTELTIRKYLWQPDDTTSAIETYVKEGSFRIMGGSITRTAPDNFKTNTPSGTIGIRGSMYAGIVKGNLLEVFFQGGKGIFVKNDFGVVEIRRPGFGTVVRGRNSPPEPPQKTNPEKLNELENTLAETGESEAIQNDTDSEPGQGVAQNDQTSTDPPAMDEDPEVVSDETLVFPTEDITTESSLTETPTVDVNSQISSSITDSTQTDITAQAEQPTSTEAKIRQLLLNEYSFTGDRSTTTPATGIWTYDGKLNNQVNTTDPSDNIKFVINWHNRRIMGLESHSTHTDGIVHGFGFGTVAAGGSIDNVTVYGSDGINDNTGRIFALTGASTFGHIYGTEQQALGIAMEGYDYNLVNPADTMYWSDVAGAVVTNKVLTTPSIYTGTQIWKGFFIGVAEDMAAPDNSRRIFFNSSAGELTFALNKNAGTLSGTLSGADYTDPANTISTLVIGGSSLEPQKSAYIQDDLLAAKLESPTNTEVSIQYQPGGIKPYGNYMVSSNETALSSYTRWGYWEMAYKEPGTQKDYHIHVPGAFWLAGEQTTASQVQNRIDTTFTGRYVGLAKGIHINTSGQMTQLENGKTDLTINFGAASPINGNISFTGHNLAVTSSSPVTTSGFTADITGASQSNNLNGAFFGTNASGIGGNFNANISGNKYHGIFAGDLVLP